MIFLSQLFSAVLQLLVLTAIPFLWYLVSNRKISGFFQWLGLKPAAAIPRKPISSIFAGLVLVTLLPYWYLYRTGSLTYSGFTIDSYRQTGWSIQTVLVILIWAALLTGGIGFALGWLSQRKAEGSILYGWWIHALVNIISPIVVFCFLL